MKTNPSTVTVVVPDASQVTSFILAAYEEGSQTPCYGLEIPKPEGGNPITLNLAEFNAGIPTENKGHTLHLWVASKSSAGTSPIKEATETFSITGGAPATPTSVIFS